jgi:copper oxidase (laccase) domain-containing protein
MDTYSSASDFYSYRREKKATGCKEKITGAHGTVVALKKFAKWSR